MLRRAYRSSPSLDHRASSFDAALPELSRIIALNLLPGAVVTALLHIALGLRPVSIRLARLGLA